MTGVHCSDLELCSLEFTMDLISLHCCYSHEQYRKSQLPKMSNIPHTTAWSYPLQQ